MKIKTLIIISLLLCVYLIFGGMTLDSEQFKLVILEIRLPALIAAILTGALLAIAGAILQIFFSNQLIGPDIIGVSSGSSLALAIYFYLGEVFIFSYSGISASISALIGSMFIMAILLFFSKRLSGSQVLILGVLISYLSSSLISLLIFLSPALQVKSYFTWLNGSFGNLAFDQLVVFLILGLALFSAMFTFTKRLELISLGEKTATALGVDFRLLRFQLLLYISLCISFVTYFVGPVGFVGIVSSFVALKVFGYRSMKEHLLLCALSGSLICLISLLIAKLFPVLPSNSNILLGFISGPIIFYMFGNKNKLYE